MSSLTKLQRQLLTAASERDDRLLVRPDDLKGGPATKVGRALVEHRLVTEILSRDGMPIWRTDEGGWSRALRATAAGLRALHDAGKSAEPSDGDGVGTPRSGTKAALVIALLSRSRGAGLDELIAATGWLPHTTRAALTRLRQAGHAVARERDALGHSVYRLADAAEA